ncbi:peptide deformylase [Corynebacterium heidelbergense]|uniref:Peptide deformylase n=1 Tax=Corynebacterium heidelbergense TaxID=2055947 RepID=A0A364V958_9CORY|nr:peptide deformylase [Corynebacterium heidelbergense]RAV33148.1 peptide deformylase [Corynebacterium heidelbergense]
MTVLNMRLFGDPVLRTVADPVQENPAEDPALRTLVADMLETMDAYGGVGLAANQVGVTKRVFVYDCDGDRGHICNPTWEPIGPEMLTEQEGCLSIPDVGGEVPRHARVRVRGTDLDGQPIDREVDGLLARCVQHETDHLDGVLFLSKLAPEQRKAAMAQIRQSEWFNQ